MNDSDENDSDSDDNGYDSDDNKVDNDPIDNNLSNNVSLPTIDFHSLNVKTLREIVSEKALATDSDKMKKKDLIKLLESDKK